MYTTIRILIKLLNIITTQSLNNNINNNKKQTKHYKLNSLLLKSRKKPNARNLLIKNFLKKAITKNKSIQIQVRVILKMVITKILKLYSLKKAR